MNNGNVINDYVSFKELVKLTGMPRYHIYRLKDKGEIKYVSISDKLFVTREEADRIIREVATLSPKKYEGRG